METMIYIFQSISSENISNKYLLALLIHFQMGILPVKVQAGFTAQAEEGTTAAERNEEIHEESGINPQSHALGSIQKEIIDYLQRKTPQLFLVSKNTLSVGTVEEIKNCNRRCMVVEVFSTGIN